MYDKIRRQFLHYLPNFRKFFELKSSFFNTGLTLLWCTFIY